MMMAISAENKTPVPNAMSSNPEVIEMPHYTLSLFRASSSDWHCYLTKPVTYFQKYKNLFMGIGSVVNIKRPNFRRVFG